jgi:hypothetical protein
MLTIKATMAMGTFKEYTFYLAVSRLCWEILYLLDFIQHFVIMRPPAAYPPELRFKPFI